MPRIRRVVNETGPTNIYRDAPGGRRELLSQYAFHITDGGLSRTFLNHIMNKPNSFFKTSWIRGLMRDDVKISIAARFENQGWRSGGKFRSILDDWQLYDPSQWEYDYGGEDMGNITDFKIYIYETVE
jgi:hypothetical protein